VSGKSWLWLERERLERESGAEAKKYGHVELSRVPGQLSMTAFIFISNRRRADLDEFARPLSWTDVPYDLP